LYAVNWSNFILQTVNWNTIYILAKQIKANCCCNRAGGDGELMRLRLIVNALFLFFREDITGGGSGEAVHAYIFLAHIFCFMMHIMQIPIIIDRQGAGTMNQTSKVIFHHHDGFYLVGGSRPSWWDDKRFVHGGTIKKLHLMDAHGTFGEKKPWVIHPTIEISPILWWDAWIVDAVLGLGSWQSQPA
jgi:hypothetical protein